MDPATSLISKSLMENGIGVGLCIVLSFMFYKVLMHFMTMKKDILKMAIENIEGLKNEMRNCHEDNKQANQFQRKEHEEMVKLLEKLLAKP